MPRPVDALIEFLEAEKARGVSHVFLDQGARKVMRELQGRANSGGKSDVSPPAMVLFSSPSRDIEKPAALPKNVTVSGTTRTERLASLRTQAENWPAAKALGTLRGTMVFATGSPDARLMLVGEAPGHHEEREREPFVGPAGQKLNDILKAMGIAREDIYISNIVKFRPATERQTTNNRKPTPEEMEVCLPFIRAEVDIIRPACIVALGGTAAEGLLGLSGAVGAMRGAWHDFAGIPVRVTYHPSYLLQSGANNSIKRQLWEDMLEVMTRLEMPVSERQRGFFLTK